MSAPGPRPRPPARRLVELATATYVAAVVLAVALVVLVAVLANPGHRVGPVQPAVPAVGSGPAR